MPPSQLKRLKASLREQGVVGPQKSKKQKRQNAQNGESKEKRVRRTAVLGGIREQFNPFEYKTSAKGPKFDVTTNRTMSGRISKSIKARPGVTKSMGEEKRRQTLLVDMQNKNRVGGIMDRRFGENDPTMAPEEKMMERFILEKQRKLNKSSAFDLEDEYEAGHLTHMGQSLSLGSPTLRDDFDDEEGLNSSDAEDHEGRRAIKRRRLSGSVDADDDIAGPDMPERKKTKQEVMKEVIAKSKLYKYERQAAKDEDEDLREELDKELQTVRALLGERRKPMAIPDSNMGGIDPARLALMNAISKEDFDKEYDKRVRQLAQDQKSAPTERTKPDEERLAEESRRLQELEAKRLRRMQGEQEDSEDEKEIDDQDNEEDDEEEDEDEFGLGSGIKPKTSGTELGVEDEDDFYIEEDLIASGTDDADSDENESGSGSGDEEGNDEESDEDDDFVTGLLSKEEAKRPEFLTGANGPLTETQPPTNNGVNGDLAFTFPCPQSHSELLEITKNVAVQDLPIVVQRIRLLYNPKLKSENKAQLGKFAVSLVDHISHLANQPDHPPFVVIETLIRHIHSMSKMFPVEISNAFRKHLESIHKNRALSLTSGDLVILTAIGTIFPTSDHFHQVVTPAILTIGRYLGQKIPQTLSDYATAAYASTLAIQYQRLSRRYVPEVINSISNTLCALAPTKLSKVPGNFPYHEPKQSMRLRGSVLEGRNLTFYDTASAQLSDDEEESLKVALLETNMKLLDAAAGTWSTKFSFFEVFESSSKILQHLQSKACRSRLPESSKSLLTKATQNLAVQLKQAKLMRRPLELHHHKPLAIKTQIPKFEESFNPDKHYDPNRDMAEAKKEKALLKKDLKKMMRSERKDANFIAREQLREKKVKDEEHAKREKRLIAEIQGEEGREMKSYEREKEWRKKGKK